MVRRRKALRRVLRGCAPRGQAKKGFRLHPPICVIRETRLGVARLASSAKRASSEAWVCG